MDYATEWYEAERPHKLLNIDPEVSLERVRVYAAHLYGCGPPDGEALRFFGASNVEESAKARRLPGAHPVDYQNTGAGGAHPSIAEDVCPFFRRLQEAEHEKRCMKDEQAVWHQRCQTNQAAEWVRRIPSELPTPYQITS